MADSALKKEFKPKDLQRIRNLIQKKYSDRTNIQAGYDTKKIVRNEGDVWEENGKGWTIKGGIKQSISKHDSFKHLVIMPLTCPECGLPMKKSNLNKKMYTIHKKCGDCVIKMETELRRVGKYKEYEKQMMNLNKDSFINDLERFINNYDELKETYIDGNGEVELWNDTNNDNELKELKEFVEKLKKENI